MDSTVLQRIQYPQVLNVHGTSEEGLPGVTQTGASLHMLQPLQYANYAVEVGVVDQSNVELQRQQNQFEIHAFQGGSDDTREGG